MRRELVCTEPATPPRLEMRTREALRPQVGQVLARVQATAVNPIDARRASGYGRRLLGLKGAGTLLAAGLREQKFSLKVGLRAPLEDASAAFAHVATGKAGRAVLLP